MSKKSNNSEVFSGLYIVIPILLIGGIYTFISVIKDNKLEEKLSKEYEELKMNVSINSFIQTSYCPDHWRAKEIFQYIKLNDGKNYFIHTKRNLTSDDVYFGDIVQPGVKIKKNAGSDTLTVITNKGEFKYLVSVE